MGRGWELFRINGVRLGWRRPIPNASRCHPEPGETHPLPSLSLSIHELSHAILSPLSISWTPCIFWLDLLTITTLSVSYYHGFITLSSFTLTTLPHFHLSIWQGQMEWSNITHLPKIIITLFLTLFCCVEIDEIY